MEEGVPVLFFILALCHCTVCFGTDLFDAKRLLAHVHTQQELEHNLEKHLDRYHGVHRSKERIDNYHTTNVEEATLCQMQAECLRRYLLSGYDGWIQGYSAIAQRRKCLWHPKRVKHQERALAFFGFSEFLYAPRHSPEYRQYWYNQLSNWSALSSYQQNRIAGGILYEVGARYFAQQWDTMVAEDLVKAYRTLLHRFVENEAAMFESMKAVLGYEKEKKRVTPIVQERCRALHTLLAQQRSQFSITLQPRAKLYVTRSAVDSIEIDPEQMLYWSHVKGGDLVDKASSCTVFSREGDWLHQQRAKERWVTFEKHAPHIRVNGQAITQDGEGDFRKIEWIGDKTQGACFGPGHYHLRQGKLVIAQGGT